MRLRRKAGAVSAFMEQAESSAYGRFVASERLSEAWLPFVVQALACLYPLTEGRGRWRQGAVAQTKDAVVGSQPGRLKRHQRDAVLLRHLLELRQRRDADRVAS